MHNSPWRVGVLFSQTGVTAAVETTQLNATLLAIDEVNATGGPLGRPLEPIVYDPASSPKRSRELAERLLASDRVRVLFGCYMSSTRKAVLPVVEMLRGLLFYPTLYEGFEYSKNCIYTGAAPNQNSIQLASYLLRFHGRRFLLIGSNYIYPYESNRLMTDFVIQSSGQVLDEIYVPLEARRSHFDKALRQIERLKPDVVFSTVVGEATHVFYTAYREAGFDPARVPIASLTTSETEVAEMASGVAEGHLTAAPFFDTLTSPTARRFVAAYRGRYGADAVVSASAEAAYFQVHIYAAALARSGTDDPDRLLVELRDAEYDAPQGRVRIDPENNHTYLWSRVGRLDGSGRFQVVWNPGLRVKPDPYCVVQRLDDWSAEGIQANGTG